MGWDSITLSYCSEWLAISCLVTAYFRLFSGHIFDLPWAIDTDENTDVDMVVFLCKDKMGGKIVIN